MGKVNPDFSVTGGISWKRRGSITSMTISVSLLVIWSALCKNKNKNSQQVAFHLLLPVF
jgi:hypothetical protein